MKKFIIPTILVGFFAAVLFTDMPGGLALLKAPPTPTPTVEPTPTPNTQDDELGPCPEEEEDILSVYLYLMSLKTSEEIMDKMKLLSSWGCQDALMKINLMMTEDIERE